METLNPHAGIIEQLFSYHMPEGGVPYALLWLLVIIFALCTVATSNTVKSLREHEEEQRKQLKVKDRQLVRDEQLIEKLTIQVNALAANDDDINPDLTPHTRE